MTTTPSTTTIPSSVELRPNFIIPAVLLLTGIPLIFVQKALGLIIALLGLFLLVQTTTIRLQFTETALDVSRSGKLLRHFPYADWINWEIFWPGVPILFYFKEVNSIHFLPIIFDPKTLKGCLETKCGNIKSPGVGLRS
ncbi:MAG: DUF3119 family protein [Limnoraphis robusta]|jgi:hypothetical protein|uniref:Glycerol dehydrogenase n=2 Tax=Limnoraphis robusta TaxID=1118279 RepID=A0A0F5YIS6_9CYAN|nr:DUF3119 family protein [Limnoraphis robusta]KKD38796.1 glycerol dehydrogenase [Limnoraphis robusta CS-951]KMW70568.1 glycerol dehydrogenase [Limnoraphis robusta CS-951]MEA5498895.1 DUF3119 family protein [Limnoraphis robusta BA-68 BA1]MEA5521799.1 DUF3119 family protein [Limnoraphis robusta CCNP1315]MEA5540503.1 DUF3119 family protein [Limnoraphis robusta Tam1]